MCPDSSWARAGRRLRRQAASKASTLLRLRIGFQPIWPGLKVAPQQNACKRQKHDCHGYAHHQCIKRHNDLPALTGGIYRRREMPVFDPDQISKTAFRIALFAAGLALQLPFFKMGALSDRLVSSTPE